MNKMITSINRKGDLSISINGKSLANIGGGHFAVTKQDLNGITLKDAHVQPHFTICDKIVHDEMEQGAMPYCVSKVNDEEAEIHYGVTSHTSCWHESLGPMKYMEAARLIVQKLAVSHDMVKISELSEDDEFIGFSFFVRFQGKTFDDVIRQADHLVGQIMEYLNHITDEVADLVESELAKIQ